MVWWRGSVVKGVDKALLGQGIEAWSQPSPMRSNREVKREIAIKAENQSSKPVGSVGWEQRYGRRQSQKSNTKNEPVVGRNIFRRA